MTEKYPRRKIGHPRPWQPEYVGDSYRGIRAAVKRGAHTIDFNLLPTDKYRDIAVAHYDMPLHHGFIDREHRMAMGVRITKMQWAHVARLESRHYRPRYTVHRAEVLFDAAFDAGLDVEGDLKAFIPQWRLTQLLDDVAHPDRVIFKTMATAAPDAYKRLRPAHGAGATTVILCHRPGIRIPHEAQRFIDFYRGYRPHWI